VVTMAPEKFITITFYAQVNNEIKEDLKSIS